MKALYHVIEDKINRKELDIAYLLLEVSITIEKWIFQSGYLFSFSDEKRAMLKDTAKHILTQLTIKSTALSYILNCNIHDLIKELQNDLYKDSINNDSYNDLILVLNSILQIDYDSSSKHLGDILQILRPAVKLEPLKKEEKIHPIKKTLIDISISIDRDVFQNVFFSPTSRQEHFTNNSKIEQCILITLWLIDVSYTDTEKRIYCLRLLRYLIYCSPNILKQEDLVSYAIDIVFETHNVFIPQLHTTDFSKLDIPKIESLFPRRVIAYTNIGNIVSDKIYESHILYESIYGYIVEWNNFKFVIPFHILKQLKTLNRNKQ